MKDREAIVICEVRKKFPGAPLAGNIVIVPDASAPGFCRRLAPAIEVRSVMKLHSSTAQE